MIKFYQNSVQMIGHQGSVESFNTSVLPCIIKQNQYPHISGPLWIYVRLWIHVITILNMLYRVMFLLIDTGKLNHYLLCEQERH